MQYVILQSGGVNVRVPVNNKARLTNYLNKGFKYREIVDIAENKAIDTINVSSDSAKDELAKIRESINKSKDKFNNTISNTYGLTSNIVKTEDSTSDKVEDSKDETRVSLK